MQRSSRKLFIGSLFGKGGGGGSSSSSGSKFGGSVNFGSFTGGSSSDGGTGQGKSMFPNVFGAAKNGESFFSPFKNGDFGSLFDKALEWCSVSHAHEIAKRKGIDLRDIKFETLPNGSIHVFVDAPHATQQQIQSLGEEVMQECPLAKFRQSQVKNSPGKQMEWLRLPEKYDR